MLLLISPFTGVSMYLTYSGAPMLGAEIFTIVSSSWIDPLIIMLCPSLSLVYFKSILSDVIIAAPALFLFTSA